MPIQLINIIPNTMSGETERDSEPDITVNPANPLQIAASAFGPFSGPNPCPIFITVDGGNVWAQNFILPGGSKTGDTSMRFGGNTSALYVGILRTDNSHMNILRTNNFTLPGIDILIDRANEDQPFVQAATAMGGGGANQDRLFVGHNDFNGGATTASVDLSQNAATAPAPAGISTARLEVRATSGQDGPSVRPAIHLDGTIYAAYFGWRTFGSPNISDVVVVRDDNWASGALPFRNLLDTGDGLAGQIVAAGVQIAPLSTTLGTQRIGSQMSIAVDPRDSRTVYIAWCDGATAATYTIHVRRSTDGGQNWSADLRTIVSATNCALAVSSHGKVGLLYQQLGNPGSGNRWRTHLEMSSDGFATAPTDLLLADVPDQNGTYGGNNPIGDYANVVALGKDFYGIFSANNTPNNANFPNGVTYQRNANFATQTLLNTDNVTPVGVSIDPFFFHWNEVLPNKDFYLRDWTNSATDHDIGQEPSTYPWFFQKSDVWNRNTNTPGPIVNDWYQGDDPTAGVGTLGDNYAFARISRNDASSAESVNVEFLSSDYGLGIPYASVGSQPINFAVGELSKLTAGQLWNLDDTASNHACLAAQLDSVDDPLILPGLSGRVPGWPYPDLQVINDNNKAQRNLHVNHVVADMDGLTMMRIRNAAFYTRDIRIRIEMPKIRGPIPRSSIEVLGGETKTIKGDDVIVLKNMRPGENRWLSFNFSSFKGRRGTELPVQFSELMGTQPINGCTALIQSSTLDEVVQSTLGLYHSVLRRCKAMGLELNPDIIKLIEKILRSKTSKTGYIQNSGVLHSSAIAMVEQISSRSKAMVTLRFEKELRLISGEVKSSNLSKILSAFTILLTKLDTALTMQLLKEGDKNAILPNVEWQISLYQSNQKLHKLESTKNMLQEAENFVLRYAMNKVKDGDYANLLKDFMESFRDTNKIFPSAKNLDTALKQIEANMGPLRLLQKAHYNYLLALYELARRQ